MEIKLRTTNQKMKQKLIKSKMIMKLIKMVPLMKTKATYQSSKTRLKMVFLIVTMVTVTMVTAKMVLMMMVIFHSFQKEVVSHFAKFIKQKRKRSQRKTKRKHFGVLSLGEMVFSLLVCTCSLMILSPRLGCIHHH